jgi:GDP-D-mannose dehydratase
MTTNSSGKKIALVTGVTGQTGSYMADLLLSKGEFSFSL